MESKTVRFTFRSFLGAAEALLVVMEDARMTSNRYRIRGRSPESIWERGLTLEGEIDAVSEKVAAISGATRHDS
jgi:hypothetical protein